MWSPDGQVPAEGRKKAGTKRRLESELRRNGAERPLALAATLPPAELRAVVNTLVADVPGHIDKKQRTTEAPLSKDELDRRLDDDSEEEDPADKPPEAVNASVLGIDRFCELVTQWTDRTVTMSVVHRMVLDGARGLPIDLASRAADDSAAEQGETVAHYLHSRLTAQLRRFESATSRFPTSGMRNVVDVEQDDTQCVCDAAIGTTGMESCIALGLTVMSGGHRYNALHHFSGVFSVAEILTDLEDAVTRCRNTLHPARESVDFSRARYLAVGGSLDSVLYQLDIVKSFSRRGSTATVRFMNETENRNRGKTAFISASGDFSFSIAD